MIIVTLSSSQKPSLGFFVPHYMACCSLEKKVRPIVLIFCFLISWKWFGGQGKLTVISGSVTLEVPDSSEVTVIMSDVVLVIRHLDLVPPINPLMSFKCHKNCDWYEDWIHYGIFLTNVSMTLLLPDLGIQKFRASMNRLQKWRFRNWKWRCTAWPESLLGFLEALHYQLLAAAPILNLPIFWKKWRNTGKWDSVMVVWFTLVNTGIVGTLNNVAHKPIIMQLFQILKLLP